MMERSFTLLIQKVGICVKWYTKQEMFHHISRHREESWKGDTYQRIFDALQN